MIQSQKLSEKKSELKNTVTEMRSTLEEINRKVDDREEWTSDLKRTLQKSPNWNTKGK